MRRPRPGDLFYRHKHGELYRVESVLPLENAPAPYNEIVTMSNVRTDLVMCWTLADLFGNDQGGTPRFIRVEFT